MSNDRTPRLLTDQKLRELAEYLMGTTDSIETGLEAIGFDPRDFDVTNVEDELLDCNTEICLGCGWWFDSGELHDGDGCDACIGE